MERLRDFGDFERFIGRFTNYERLPHFDYSHKTLGPERVRGLAEAVGSPQRSYPSVHVAGTKGKGSTSLILEALLRASGYRVGTYTSPHVEHLRERIRVEGTPIDSGDLIEELNDMLSYLEHCSEHAPKLFPTFFEIMTVLAMAAFRRAGVDWGVFEVGLGGRLDATNILEPRWTAITSIGLEHTAYLGDTLAAIAGEKAGIIKPATPVVVGPMDPEALGEIARVAEERGAPQTLAQASDVRVAAGGALRLPGLAESVGPGRILGPALRIDLAIAFEILTGILERDGRSVEAEPVDRALRELELPGRAEWFPGTPPIVLDGAHTQESMAALGRTLNEIELPRPRTIILALARDKQVEAVLSEVKQLGDRFLLTQTEGARALEPSKLRELLGEGEVFATPEDAMDRAVAIGEPVVVTGSFYLVGSLRPRLT